MTPTVPESIVLEALLARMRTFVTVLPVQWPGEVLESAAEGRKRLECIFMPNQTYRVGINDTVPHRYFGIFQVTVYWPIDDGNLSPVQLAGEIAEHFAADTKMIYAGKTVRSMKRPTVETPVKKGPDLLVPVTVEYESYI